MVKKYYIFGLGKSGTSIAKYLINHGHDVIVFDENCEDKTLPTRHYEQIDWQKVDYFILNPAINPNHKAAEMARQNKIPIIGDIEAYWQHNKNQKYIAITGTNGKSTTTTLLHHTLKMAGKKVQMGGNIGIPIADLLPDEDYINIIETSSYQLELLDKTQFNISALLNITPDHLDRHGTIENYADIKGSIFARSKEGFIFAEDEYCQQIAKKHPNITSILEIYNLPSLANLAGLHNAKNLTIVIEICNKLGVSQNEVIEYARSFTPLTHRMQLVATHNNIAYINDSKATNAISAQYALDAYKNILWIVGGLAKDGGLKGLESHISNVKHAYIIGAKPEEFIPFMQDNNISYSINNTLDNAFAAASKHASPNDNILLSPATASFDQFKSFEKRGERFIELVEKLN